MKYILTLVLSLFFLQQGNSHAMWITTSSKGELNQAHEVKVFFGEFSHGVKELTSGDSFKKMSQFKLYVIDPMGNKSPIVTTQEKDHFRGAFTPKLRGVYTVVMDNDDIPVIDFTKYNFGIFKTHYHSEAKVIVGDENNPSVASNHDGFSIVYNSLIDNNATMQILYKGVPAVKQEVEVFMPDQWSKKLTTDENGMITFNLPWMTDYLVEVSQKEEVPGTFKGEEYEFIWHAATFLISR